ncbi:MAG TPA: PEP-CTERM sorting domain-containing protein [bacterium]|nr:PEP-CTERM sorting domain-containing protein [bacterium]
MGRHILYALVLSAAIAGTAAAAEAAAYDISSDFSTASSSNGVWSYGYAAVPAPNSVPALFLYDQTEIAACTGGSAQVWRSSGPVTSLQAPANFNNPNNNSINCGNYNWPAHTAAFHPASNGDWSIYRFTAPSAGGYALDATFIVLDSGGTDVHILKNGTEIYTANSAGLPSGSTFGALNQTLALAAGEVIDFGVGVGSDGNFFSDGTGINATLTSDAAVPEPSTLLLLAASLPGLGFIRRRTR